jgi:hypothetical protein
MQNRPTAFESLKAGKGRLYPMPKEKRIEEWNRLKQYDWATKANVPKYDGFIKITREFIDQLEAGLAAHNGADYRCNLKVCEQMGDDGNLQQLNVDFWIPKPNPNAAPAAKPVDDFDDDDIPF